ncbi:sporulation protein [Nonomuraea sp. 3-1Str]|uniref:spore germination protein GerW family protein n=1 Tax=Nonomuraea sp. 3-1Str TaxID=2929801 RepID=UPI00285C036F|nr:spore germination protein GerW family protein [Nonomuraea sp. 3-1Str]MDR8410250.1 sporulation protein [Nonomuraea sp. 3-1Str]
MDIMQLIEKSRDAANVKRVFGEPLRQGDVTVVPVVRVFGGGGGGSGSRRGGEGKDGEEGSGGGYGYAATPAGAFVIKDGDVRWQPAVDVNRIVLGGQIVAVVLLLTLRSILRKRRRR